MKYHFRILLFNCLMIPGYKWRSTDLALLLQIPEAGGGRRRGHSLLRKDLRC